PPTALSTLSLHDALPICLPRGLGARASWLQFPFAYELLQLDLLPPALGGRGFAMRATLGEQRRARNRIARLGWGMLFGPLQAGPVSGTAAGCAPRGGSSRRKIACRSLRKRRP